jgi:peroxiredoxin
VGHDDSRFRRRSWLIAAVALAFLSQVVRGWKPHEAPPVEIVSLRGERVMLDKLRGRPVIVTFWASDCRTCLLEIPEWEALYRDLSPQGLALFAVAMSYDVPSRVLALAESRRTPYTVALDPMAGIAGKLGGVEFVPTTLLIAPDGTIRYRLQGPVDFPLVRQAVKRFLGDS